jgi:outer membrane protein TolC
MKVLGVLSIVLVAATTARAEPPLTLDAAIQLALTRNERAQIADLDVTVAEANVSRARTAFLPVVDVSGSDVVRPRSDPWNTAQAQLAISQPILNPSAQPLYSQAKHTLAARRATRTDDRRRLAFEAANAYMTVLFADQVVQAAQRKLDTATTNLASTDAQLKAQLVSSNDVTRAQVNIATASRDLAASRGNLETAYLELELLLNAKVARGLEAPAALLSAGKRPPGIADDLVAASIARRADLTANKQLALAAHDFAREPRMRYLPSVELGGQLTATTNPPGSGHSIDGQLAISARWTLFDAGSRSAEARARSAQAAIADLETAALARSIAAEVRSAALLLASRQQALAAAASARDAARKGADEAAILYRQGLAKAIELVDANDQRFIAEVNYATSEFDVASAYLALRQAMGLDPLEAP